MNFFIGLSEIKEASEVNSTEGREISKEANDKLDKLMGDDSIREVHPEAQERPKLDPVERENKFDKLFDIDDFFKKDMTKSEQGSEQPDDLTDTNEQISEQPEGTDHEPDHSEKREPNSYVTIDGERYRTDDNGNIYQKRNPETGTYECLPNTEYELNGYSYRTDDSGRIVHVSGTLKEKNHEGRPTINDDVNGMKDTDEKGHLIGDQFEGSNLNGNLVAMDFDVNRSDYKKLEEKLAKYVNEDHKNVTVSIDVEYEDESDRPSGFTVMYTVDGETFKEKFNN